MKNISLLMILSLICGYSVGQEIDNCGVYRTGYFEFEGKHSNVVIYRIENYQIEYNTDNGDWVTIDMNWKNDCEYSFTYLDTNMEGLKQYIGHSLQVEIVSGDSNGYEYHSIYERGGKEFDGRVIFLTSELSKSKKKKITELLESKTKT